MKKFKLITATTRLGLVIVVSPAKSWISIVCLRRDRNDLFMPLHAGVLVTIAADYGGPKRETRKKKKRI